MSRPRHRRAIVVMALALGLFLLLVIFLLIPDRNSLAALQKRITETGTCSISTAITDCVIQADTARIEDDTLILARHAATGDDAFVVISIGVHSVSAKRVSVRLTTSPKDILELTLYDPEPGTTNRPLFGAPRTLWDTGEVCMRVDRHRTLRQRFHHLCGEIKRTFQ